MPTETRYALVTDDNVGEVLFEVATTEGLLESLLKMNPIDAVRRLSKISQKYDSDSDGSALSKVTQKQVEIPKTMPRTGTPPRSTQPVKSSTKYDDNMSFTEYAKLRASGKI